MPKKREIRERPAMTAEGRESQIIAKAMDLAEQRIADGTASNTLLVHFLKEATGRARLEREILERQAELITAKTDHLRSEESNEKLYLEAMDAFKLYSGQ